MLLYPQQILISGFLFGIVLGLAFRADTPWPRYFITTAILAVQRKLPWRLARFLDWGYAVGLLGFSGLAAQFRHRDLQEFLAKEAQT